MKVQVIDLMIGDYVMVRKGAPLQRVTESDVHMERGDGLRDGDIRLRFEDGSSRVFRYDRMIERREP